MNINTKIQLIGQKTATFRKQKTQITQKQVRDQARLIKKCGLAELTPEAFAGALLEIKQQMLQKREEWRQDGETFLRGKI